MNIQWYKQRRIRDLPHGDYQTIYAVLGDYFRLVFTTSHYIRTYLQNVLRFFSIFFGI